MTWRDITTRLTGFSVPIFGVQWTPTDADRTAVRCVLAFLQERVLYEAAEYEHPDACVKSVESIREQLIEEIGKLESSSELSKSLRAMSSACRFFLNTVQKKSLIVVRLSDYPTPAKHWEFIEALEGFRKDIGYRIAVLAVSYGIDIESELQSILPPKSDDESIATELSESEAMPNDIQAITDNAQVGFSGIELFLRGVGSVLEFFPPAERLDAWRVTQAVPADEWPVVARGLLDEMRESV
jgi:hypothetical protein